MGTVITDGEFFGRGGRSGKGANSKSLHKEGASRWKGRRANAAPAHSQGSRLLGASRLGRPVSRTRLPRAPRQARGSDVWVSGLPTASQTTPDPKELLPTQVRPRDTYCINDYGRKSGGLEETAARTPSAVRVRTPCCMLRTHDRQRGRRTASPRPGRPGLAKSSPAAGQHGRRHPRKALVLPSWSPGRAGRRAVRSPAQPPGEARTCQPGERVPWGGPREPRPAAGDAAAPASAPRAQEGPRDGGPRGAGPMALGVTVSSIHG